MKDKKDFENVADKERLMRMEEFRKCVNSYLDSFRHEKLSSTEFLGGLSMFLNANFSGEHVMLEDELFCFHTNGQVFKLKAELIENAEEIEQINQRIESFFEDEDDGED